MLNKRTFRKINTYTIIAVYLLIVVGSIVRVTEAGMGCPDWPKCFGGYAPPTHVSQLPENYKEIYLEKRLSKNERLSGLLMRLNLTGLANRIINDPDIQIEEDYSSTKAWIEYINRLIGVLIGFFIIANMIWSFSYRRIAPIIPVIAVFAFILVLFQGWIGSLVVSTNLLPGFISFHMSLALLLVAFLIYINYKSSDRVNSRDLGREFKVMAIVIFVLSLPQILMGTQVREIIDMLLNQEVGREALISQMPVIFYIHRSFSLLILIIAIYGAYRLYKVEALSSHFGLFWLISLGIIIAEAIGGAIMTYFEVPRSMQPLHLLGASILFGTLYYLTLISNFKAAKA
ncbi:MAG: COX15/CtaA family protein [Cytophagales bacterium]|nr:COX15/CtaA family protein [Cytophagales bacterium]